MSIFGLGYPTLFIRTPSSPNTKTRVKKKNGFQREEDKEHTRRKVV
jgi:hypothetical protein